jgi:hypothetical protein
MASFGLVASFGIDNGELDGLSRQECFVLGFELSTIYELLKQDSPIDLSVHAHNHHRIERFCRDAKRDFSLTWLPGAKSETWMVLRVPPRD